MEEKDKKLDGKGLDIANVGKTLPNFHVGFLHAFTNLVQSRLLYLIQRTEVYSLL